MADQDLYMTYSKLIHIAVECKYKKIKGKSWRIRECVDNINNSQQYFVELLIIGKVKENVTSMLMNINVLCIIRCTEMNRSYVFLVFNLCK